MEDFTGDEVTADGPDWAGLWELPTPKPDYAALVGRVRDDYSCTDALHRSLADAVEALVKDRDKWRNRAGHAETEVESLRHQLDSMTVEERHHYIPPRSEHGGVLPGGRLIHEQRLVSPWTVVEGGS